MSSWLETFIVLSVVGSVVLICILMLNSMFKTTLTPKQQYFFRKISLLFFVIPIWLVNRIFPLTGSGMGASSGVVQQANDSVEGFYLSMEWIVWLLIIWGIGMFVFWGWHIYCHHKFTKEIMAYNIAVPTNHEIHMVMLKCKKTLKIRGNVKVSFNEKIASPALIGLIHPTIVLPIRKTCNVEYNMIFHHELIHFKRRDLWVKVFAVIISAIHWFNPFVHILRKEIYLWSEFSCDGDVVAPMSVTGRKRYGNMILNMVHDSIVKRPLYGAFFSTNSKILKKRLEMIIHLKEVPPPIVLPIILIIFMTGSGLIIGDFALGKFPLVDPIYTEAIFYVGDQKGELSN